MNNNREKNNLCFTNVLKMYDNINQFGMKINKRDHYYLLIWCWHW